MYRRFFALFSFALLMTTCLFAQKKTVLATMYPKNKTAIVTLKDGRKVNTPNANVFLKNASLLYFQGSTVKEANMDVISKVDIEDRSFINVENQLAYFVDSIKGNSLYCVEIIDMDAFERSLKNNVNYTFIDLSSDRLDSFTNNMNTEENFVYPVIHQYWFLLDGKLVQAHDRELWRVLNKQRYRMMKTAISDPLFSWTDKDSLMKLLNMISR